MNYLDTDQDGTINIDEFLIGIRVLLEENVDFF